MAKRHEGMMSLPGLPPGPTEPKSAESRSKVDPIDEMVGALTDPIIVFPSGWEDTMPEWMKRDLPLHRLAHVHQCLVGKASWEEACDLEALIYMYPAALAQPLGEVWTRIYVYLGTKVMGDKMPEDVREESIPDHYQEDLRDLKRWIRKKKVEARKDRQRREKAAKKAEVEPVECEQLKFF
jgi:hypothetical protein